ncbi:Hypothetical predicted protein, partial [Paramuricea clavata]
TQSVSGVKRKLEYITAFTDFDMATTPSNIAAEVKLENSPCSSEDLMYMATTPSNIAAEVKLENSPCSSEDLMYMATTHQTSLLT